MQELKIDSEKSILDNFSEDLDISIFRPLLYMAIH